MPGMPDVPQRKTPLREQKFLIGSVAVGALIGAGIFLVPRLLDGGGPALLPRSSSASSSSPC
jgi:hypothetical protein